MGYCTLHKIEIDLDDKTAVRDIAQAMREGFGEYVCLDEEIDRYLMDETVGGHMTMVEDEDSKWWFYESDMMKLSDRYPECRFTVLGAGEDPKDNWEHIFKGGKAVGYKELKGKEKKEKIDPWNPIRGFHL